MKELIVCKDLNGAIGYNNQLLCHLPNDLKYFKELTLGKNVIMGRKTWDSLPIKPLPGRVNYIFSSNSELYDELYNQYKVEIPTINCIGLNALEEYFKRDNPFEFNYVVLGGAQIYKAAINNMDILHVTEIQHKFENADVYFPHIDISIWEETERIINKADDKHEYEYHFITYKKRVIKKSKTCFVVTDSEAGWDCVLGVCVAETEKEARRIFNEEGWDIDEDDDYIIFHKQKIKI